MNASAVGRSAESILARMGRIVGGAVMEYRIQTWCQKVMDNWANATLYDFAFIAAWIVLIGFLVSKTTSFSAR